MSGDNRVRVLFGDLSAVGRVKINMRLDLDAPEIEPDGLLDVDARKAVGRYERLSISERYTAVHKSPCVLL